MLSHCSQDKLVCVHHQSDLECCSTLKRHCGKTAPVVVHLLPLKGQNWAVLAAGWKS